MEDYEKCIAIGFAESEIKIILNMHKKGFPLEQIALATDKNIDDIKTIIDSPKNKAI